MGKVIKIILSFLSAVILTLLLLPVLASLLLNLQFVQNFVGRQATAWLGKQLHTDVRIDQLQLKLFNRVTLHGLYIEDYHQDTLLYAKQVIVPLRQLNLFSGHIMLGNAELIEPRFYLVQDSTGITNLKQILNNADFPKAQNDLKLKAAGLRIQDMYFRHIKRDRIDRGGAVNFTDLEVSDFNLQLRDINLQDSITVRIDTLRLHEKSGLIIENFSAARVNVSGEALRLQQVHLSTPDSELSLPFLHFLTGSFQAYKNFVEDVTLQADVVDSRVGFRTIGYFVPKLRDQETTFEHFTLWIDGPLSGIKGNIERLETGDTHLSTRFAMSGLPDINRTRFDLDISELSTDYTDISRLLTEFTGKQLDQNVVVLLEELGTIRFRGKFDGLVSNFTTEGTLTANPGELGLSLEIQPQSGNRTAFKGHLGTIGFQAGSLLHVENLDWVSLQADVNGVYGVQELDLTTNALLNGIRFNGYTYEGIELSGDFKNRNFMGSIHSPDPNIHFDFEGQLDFNDSIPDYDFRLALYNADLHALGFNRRDSVSLIRAELEAEFSGTDMDNINGRAAIRNMTYINPVDTVRTGDITFTAENNAQRKMISMSSAFADAELIGRLSYHNMVSYFTNTLVNYLPSIKDRSNLIVTEVPMAPSRDADPDSYYALNIDVKEANNVAGIFLPGLQVAQGTRVSFLFNPVSDVFNLNVSSEFIERGNFFISNLVLNSRNQGDSISLFLQSDDIYGGGVYLPNFSVIGGIRENNINLATRYQNRENGNYAMISTVSRLTQGENGQPQLRVRFNPSNIYSGGQSWDIWAREIVIDSTHIGIDRFAVVNGEQSLQVFGVASRNTADTIHLRFNKFNLGTVSQISERAGYRFDGYANGYIDMVSALNEGLLQARVALDSLQINDIPFRNTAFESQWDFQQQRARVTLFDEETQSPIIQGYYRPQDRRFLANVNLKNIDLALLEPVVEGVLLNPRGTAHAQVQLTNPNGQLAINGNVKLDSLVTLIEFTNVTYAVRDQELDFVNNVLTLDSGTVEDAEGHSGNFDFKLDLTNFRRVGYEIHVRPQNLQVLNTSVQENDFFYGTVYADGEATIRGSRNFVTMNVRASTAGDSHFYMAPLSNRGDISQADFIRFRDPSKVTPRDTLQTLSRRQQILQQREGRRRVRADSRLTIDMDLTVLPNAEIQIIIDPETGDMVRGRGNGNFNMHLVPSNNDFRMYGDYNITDGNYFFNLRNLLTRTFTIQPGSSIQWAGDPLDARLNITGVYNLRASIATLLNTYGYTLGATTVGNSTPVQCIIHLGDELTNPTITFDVQLPNADPDIQSIFAYTVNTQEAMATQFLWLLATRTFYTETDLRSGAALGAANTGIDFLATQFSTLLTTDRFSFIPKYSPRGEFTSDQVGGSLYGELIKDRLILEADFSYSAQNSRENEGMEVPVSGDATLSLLLDPGGHLRLRAFTRTIDRYVENLGQYETGIGITYKEDFENFQDLKRIILQRFNNMGRRRQERRRDALLEQQEAMDLPVETGLQSPSGQNTDMNYRFDPAGTPENNPAGMPEN